MAKTIYLSLEVGSGRFFEKSKTEKDGYEKFVGTNPNTKTDVISYRKYHEDGVFGYLVGFDLVTKEFEGRKVSNLVVSLDNPEKGETYHCNIPWKNSKGQLGSIAVSGIRYLPNLEEGRAYCLKAYSIEDKDSGRKNYGVYFRIARLSDNAVDNENKIPTLGQSYSKKNDKGEYEEVKKDIPAIKFEEKMGEWVVNTDDRDEYLWKTLQEHKIEYEYAFGGGKTFNSKEAEVDKIDPSKLESVKEDKVEGADGSALVDEDYDDDDLPF